MHNTPITSKFESSIQQYLTHLIDQNPKTLGAYVAHELLNAEDISSYIANILSHGCESGCVSSLVYYNDTHEFFDTFYQEIEQLRESYEINTGLPIEITGDLKNFFAWFAFEETTRQIAHEMGIH